MNNKKYFEKKMHDRRKRTYEVLKQFDAELADFILDEPLKEQSKATMPLTKETAILKI